MRRGRNRGVRSLRGTKTRLLQRVASGPGRAACCLELVGKKGDSGSGILSGKMCLPM